MLELRLLGTPQVLWNGEQITVSRKRTRALLFYLAMHPQGVDRGKLAELFGGDGDDETQKRTTLRQYLSFVRGIAKELDFVITQYENVRIDLAVVQVDALQLLEIAARIKKHKGSYDDVARTIPFELYKKAEQLLDALGGTDFVNGTDLDKPVELSQWRQVQDMHLKAAQHFLCTTLAEMNANLAKPTLSLAWAERALAVDRSEDAYYFQLRAWRDLGEFEKARTMFGQLQTDFGLDMSSRLNDLGESILNMTEASPTYVRPVLGIHPSVPAPFVGQRDVLQRVRRNYQNGIGSLITGEAGAGKTRLVKEFHESMTLKPNLLLVPCYRDSERLPYQPWTDMLRHSFTEEFWQTTPAWWTEPLTMLLPELHTYRDDLDVEPGDVFANGLVFEAMKNLLVFAHEQSAALLFVDDAQWMNTISFDLLKYLIIQSTFKQWNIGLVVTSRLGLHAGLDRFEFAAMQSKIEEIKITPLEDADIQYLAFFLMNDTLPDEQVVHLRRQTGGNPYFVLEFLNFHLAQDQVDILSQPPTTPVSIRQVIAVRLANLSKPARRVLNYAAVQGNRFGLSVLEEVLEIPPDEMSTIIVELEAARLIYFVDDDGDLFYAFFHETLREEALSLLTPVEKRMMHAKFAEVLAQKSIYQDELAALLAEHYEQAGKYSEAFQAWSAAAAHAYRFFSPNDAHNAYLRAEKLLSRITISDEERYTFYHNWQVTLFYHDDHENLEAVMDRLLSYGKKRGSSLLIGAALDGLSDVCMIRNEFKKGLDFTEQALAYLIMDAHVPAQMNAFIHQGVFHYMLKDFPASLKSFETVLSLANENESWETMHPIGHANYQMAVGFTGMGYPRQALEYARQSLHYMRLSSVPYATILPHNIMGLANYYLGEYAAGKHHALHSFALAKQNGSWRMLGYAAAYAGMNETELPELGNAWQHAQDAIRYGKKYRHTEIEAMGYKIIGDIYARLEAPLKAVDAYQKGLMIDQDSFVTAENAARLGVTLGLLGKPEADALLEEALIGAHQAGLETIEFNARALQLSLFIAQKDYQTFDDQKENVRDALVTRSHAQSFVWIDYLQTLRLSQEGKREDALALVEKNLPTFENIEFFWIHMRLLRLYVELLTALGRDATQPREKLAEMLTTIQDGLGDAPLEDEWAAFSKKIKSV